MTTIPREPNGRFASYKVLTSDVSDLGDPTDEWFNPHRFASEEELVEWFTRKASVPDWVLTNITHDYPTARELQITKTATIAADDAVSAWEEAQPDGIARDAEWMIARRSEWARAYAIEAEQMARTLPLSISAEDARGLAIIARMISTFKKQFPSSDRSGIQSMMVSTPFGDLQVSEFVDQCCGRRMDARALTDPSFLATKAAEEADRRMRETQRRARADAEAKKNERDKQVAAAKLKAAQQDAAQARKQAAAAKAAAAKADAATDRVHRGMALWAFLRG